MLIICTDEEKRVMRKTCAGECRSCVLGNVNCPISENMIITDTEVERGKDLEIH